MNDIALLKSAIRASGLSSRRFADEVLDVNERTVRAWIAGRPIPMSVKLLAYFLAESDRPVTMSALSVAREVLDRRSGAR